MEATNNFAVFESAAKQPRVIPIYSRPGIWRSTSEAEQEPRSVVGLVVAVGLSLSVWALVGVALLA